MGNEELNTLYDLFITPLIEGGQYEQWIEYFKKNKNNPQFVVGLDEILKQKSLVEVACLKVFSSTEAVAMQSEFLLRQDIASILLKKIEYEIEKQ